jgi:transcriptional regulator with XRE-family HTH domain
MRSVDVMDNRAEVREFLTTRRAKLSPADAGLPDIGQRRVPGLRRAEVAILAGVSVEYYSKLERGQIAGASASVLNSLAAALRLDDTERAHLFDLARAADGVPTSGRARRRPGIQIASRPSLHWALEAITDGIAVVTNSRLDVLATNALGRAFYKPIIGDGGRTPNLARFQFLDPASHDFYPDWHRFAHMCVANMRTQAGRDPHDRGLQDLVGELSTQSETFRRLWAAHDVRTHGTGTKRFHHPDVGELTLAYEELAITSEPGTHMLIYSAEPGSPSAEKLRLLASLAADERKAAPAVDAVTD